MRILMVDPSMSDTSAFIKETGATAQQSLNSIVVTIKRFGRRDYAMILVPANCRLENKGLKRELGGKVSFMSMEAALELTGMERDSIGPIGAPKDLPVVADLSAIEGDEFFIGGGKLGRKYVISRAELEEIIDQEAIGIYSVIR